MAYEAHKHFLNAGILGAGAIMADQRGFCPVRTEYIGSPEYSARFFETFPTLWASAYAFRKSLEANETQALEEWVALFTLHYFGVIHLQVIPAPQLRAEYAKELWTVLEGTFPRAGTDSFTDLSVLQTDDHAIVGACYPETVFFPARDRASWRRSDSLRPYLEHERLIWEKCAPLLDDENDRQQIHRHLRAVMASVLHSQGLRTRLENFCNQQFGAFYADAGRLSPNPQAWQTIVRREIPPAELLADYPLQKSNEDGSKIYFLVADMPQLSPWMTTKISSERPAPSHYLRTGAREISVKFAGKVHRCSLADKDDILLLKDLLLPHPPYWCKVPRNAEAHAAKIRLLHEVAMQDTSLRQQEMAICLAPLTRKFLKYFPEVLQDARNLRAIPSIGGAVEWSITILGKEVRWLTKPIGATGMTETSLALWPPKVSPKWKLYAAYGVGKIATYGRWHLVDEAGTLGAKVDIEEDVYVSVLHREGRTPNRPRGMLFTDAGGKERGVLLLADLPDPGVDDGGRGILAVDFGTSNTCLAVNTGTESEVLRLSLSPVMLWGQPAEDELPGFVPNKWGGSKGFFPTILFSRKSDDSLPEIGPDMIQLKHLFKVDIPCLHKGIEAPFYQGNFQPFWRTHTDLKWMPKDPQHARRPWRSLFLELLLLYAHGEVFFNKKARLGRYAFTYPLAFSSDYGNTYHTRVHEAIKKIRHYCYGESLSANNSFEYVKVDESTAIARAIRQAGAPGALEVFMDVGGGTADIALRHHQDFLVLDSVQVAGKAFFRFAKNNFTDEGGLQGASQFKLHLGRLLLNQHQELSLNRLEADFRDNLGLFYSVCINDLEDKIFNEREEEVVKAGAGAQSYQRYRSRLFFRHLLTYALLQSCAAVVSQRITLHNGINLILGGNGWGLLLFAEIKREAQRVRSEADLILGLLKQRLAMHITEDEQPYLAAMRIQSVELLNETSLSKSKNSVARGALLATAADAAVSEKAPYAGITKKNFRINNLQHADVRWCERWSLEEFRARFGHVEQINSINFAPHSETHRPLDDTLALFTSLGNMDNFGEDNLPAGIWAKVNSEILGNLLQLSIAGERLSSTPINHYLSEVLYPASEETDFLDKLAETNGNYRSR